MAAVVVFAVVAVAVVAASAAVLSLSLCVTILHASFSRGDWKLLPFLIYVGMRMPPTAIGQANTNIDRQTGRQSETDRESEGEGEIVRQTTSGGCCRGGSCTLDRGVHRGTDKCSENFSWLTSFFSFYFSFSFLPPHAQKAAKEATDSPGSSSMCMATIYERLAMKLFFF